MHVDNIDPRFEQLFRNTIGLDKEEYHVLLDAFEFKTLAKKKYYMREGDICYSKAYLNKGCMRTFVMDEKGHERILFFPTEDLWIGDFDSYYNQTPGTNYIQALEDCELFLITKTQFDKLEVAIPKLRLWYTVKVVPAMSASRKRFAEIKTLTPEERYLQLLEKQPTLVDRVPLQYIAAYLNIEPPSLSRLRRRLAQKH